MNVDFLHNQIIRDTVSPKFIESFNESLLPTLCLKYGEALECIQFYEDHLREGFRIGGIFYYPLTLVISGAARTEWISWQVANYRHYDNFNPFTYKGQEFLSFHTPEEVPESVLDAMVGRPIYSAGNTLPVIVSAETDDKTFLAGRYSQGFIDLLSAEITEAIEKELAISGLAGSGVVLEMSFAPGTFMEHVSENTTYRRLRIKARACAARDLWVKWTRLDKNGTYTVSDNVNRSEIRFALAEDVPGKIKEKEYRYLTSESVEKYQASMGRKNITEWREMMRRVIRRGEVERYERIKIAKPKIEEVEEQVAAEQKLAAAPEVNVGAPTVSFHGVSAATENERDEITERLNAILGKKDEEFAKEPEALAETINSDLTNLLRGALGVTAAENETEEETLSEETEELDSMLKAVINADVSEEDAAEEKSETLEEENSFTETEDTAFAENEETSEVKNATATVDEKEIEARIRRELEEKMRAEVDAIRKQSDESLEAIMKKQSEEADALRKEIEAKSRAEKREQERITEAARLLLLDKEKLEANRRAEAERDRIEAERKAAELKAAEEARRKEQEAQAERERIEAELNAQKSQTVEAAEPEQKYITKTVTLIFNRGGVDRVKAKKVSDVIVATIKELGKKNVHVRIKMSIPDPMTLKLVFTDVPEEEHQMIVDIIQVLGVSKLGVSRALLD